MQQRSAAAHQVDDGLVGVPHALAGVFGESLAQDTLLVDVAGGIEPVFHAGHEIFGAVRRSGMDNARSGVHSDVVGEHTQNLSVKKWMLEVQALQLAAGEV